MNSTLLEKLSIITKEEQQIINGKNVDISKYTQKNNKIFDAKSLLEDDTLIDIRTHTRFIHFPRHKHDFIEIMYVCQGSITHIIGDKKVTVNQGELLFLGRNSWHEILPAAKEDIGINFLIRPTFFKAAFFHKAFDTNLMRNPIADFMLEYLSETGLSDEYLLFQVGDVLPIQNLVENLVYSLCQEARSQNKDELTMALLLMLLIEHSQSSIVNTDQSQAIAFQVLQYINTNYADAQLQDISDQLGIPLYKASRILKSELNVNFRQLLMQRRFSVAQQLLTTTKLTITEIISTVGYENSSYFYREFQKHYGLTPQEYRNKNQK